MIPEDLVPVDCPWPIVLGLDPGNRVAGWGAVVCAPDGPRLVACGVLRPPARASAAARLGAIAAELEILLDRVRPETVALEGAFASRNIRSALRLGEARGAMLATAARRGVAIVEISPASAKKAVVGNGAASKQQVAAMVATILGVTLDVPEDATDALALALAHVQRMAMAEKLGQVPRHSR